MMEMDLIQVITIIVTLQYFQGYVSDGGVGVATTGGGEKISYSITGLGSTGGTYQVE